MQSVGYSGKPLIQKLGYLTKDHLQLLHAPTEFRNYLQAEGVLFTQQNPTWFHAFFNSVEELVSFLSANSLDTIQKGLWVSWPKKKSGLQTDLTEQSFRDLILPLGWVDTKVCAIDDIWSGLLFRRRKV